jgi:hypothetical protein
MWNRGQPPIFDGVDPGWVLISNLVDGLISGAFTLDYWLRQQTGGVNPMWGSVQANGYGFALVEQPPWI